MNFETLRIDEDVAALCVSRPTNPTGNVIADAELRQLDTMARQAGVPLIVDNAYGLPFPRIVFAQATPFWNDNVILCMSLSKLGMPGIRTGIVVAREEIIGALSNMTAVHSLAVASAGAVLVEPWIENGEIIEISRRCVTPFYAAKAQAACGLLKRELEGVPFRIHVPEGAFLFVAVAAGPADYEPRAVSAPEGQGRVRDVRTSLFPRLAEPWRHRDECLRLSYAQDDAVVEAGLRIVGEEVRSLYARDA